MLIASPCLSTFNDIKMNFLLQLVSLALIASCGLSAKPIDSFYPNLSNPSSIVNPKYNPLMKGGKRETRNGTSDGSYSYCSMPHPNVAFYEEPTPIKNGSIHANLTKLLYIQRHQKRTMYHVFPNGEKEIYFCNDIRPHVYVAPSADGEIQPMPVFAQTYVDFLNPLYRTFTNSTCQFPQITLGGFLDGVQHGKELRELYGDKYHVIPDQPDPHRVWMRSSTAALTQDSASGVLRGIWPDVQGPLPLFQQADQVDTHEPSCDRADSLLSAAKKTDAWKKHLSVTKHLRKELEAILQTNVSDWQSDWDHYNDNFQARLCNGYQLPCSNDDPTKCVTKDQARKVFAAGDWEYNYYWVARDNVTEAIRLTSGLYIKDLIEQLKEMNSGNSDLQYVHHFMHDGDIGPLAGSLGIKSLRWPGMASNIAIELWTANDGKNYVRALYSGHTIHSRHGNMEWMPFDDFISYWSKFVPANFVSQCKKSL